MGLGFSVGSGVRVSGSSRGLGVSVGKGPVRYSTRIGGGRSRSGSSPSSVAAYERQVRQTQRMEEIQAVVDLDNGLAAMCTAHQEHFEPAARPAPAEPEPVDRGAVSKRLAKEAVQGISALKLGERRRARRAALENLDAEVAAEEQRRIEHAAELKSEWDQYWDRLVANDPRAVLPALEQAFDDNEAPAAAVSCRGARVDVVIRWPSLEDVVSERKAAITPSGKPTIHKRNKGERAELYLEALSSHALATAKEAFAVCPKIKQVGLAIVRNGFDPARGDQTLEPIVLAVVSREDFDRIQWSNINATAAFLEGGNGRIGMRGKGANKTLFGLDLDSEPEEKQFIAQVADGLDARVPENGIAGIPLPVRVVAA